MSLRRRKYNSGFRFRPKIPFYRNNSSEKIKETIKSTDAAEEINGNRPRVTFQEILNDSEIEEELEGFIKVNTFDNISAYTHIKYFKKSKDGYNFKYDGYLYQKPNSGYVILQKANNVWSVPIDDTIFFKKMTPSEEIEHLHNYYHIKLSKKDETIKKWKKKYYDIKNELNIIRKTNNIVINTDNNKDVDNSVTKVDNIILKYDTDNINIENDNIVTEVDNINCIILQTQQYSKQISEDIDRVMLQAQYHSEQSSNKNDNDLKVNTIIFQPMVDTLTLEPIIIDTPIFQSVATNISTPRPTIKENEHTNHSNRNLGFYKKKLKFRRRVGKNDIPILQRTENPKEFK
jgi:hypothetical protein